MIHFHGHTQTTIDLKVEIFDFVSNHTDRIRDSHIFFNIVEMHAMIAIPGASYEMGLSEIFFHNLIHVFIITFMHSSIIDTGFGHLMRQAIVSNELLKKMIQDTGTSMLSWNMISSEIDGIENMSSIAIL